MAAAGAGDSACFLGFKHGQELSTIYASSDLFVFPSTTDTLGQVVMEAQSAGLPVIAIAEAYLVSHKGPTRSWETYDAFAVIGYQIPPITPYIKAERLVMTAGLDPFFVPDPLGVNNGNVPPPLPELDVVDGIVGARWDMSNWCALKGEYRFDKLIDSGELVHSTFFSWQFAL